MVLSSAPPRLLEPGVRQQMVSQQMLVQQRMAGLMAPHQQQLMMTAQQQQQTVMQQQMPSAGFSGYDAVGAEGRCLSTHTDSLFDQDGVQNMLALNRSNSMPY